MSCRVAVDSKGVCNTSAELGPPVGPVEVVRIKIPVDGLGPGELTDDCLAIACDADVPRIEASDGRDQSGGALR